MEQIDLRVNTKHGNFSCRVAALILQDGRLLTAKHRDYPYYYTVGGGVRLNETSEEAAIREVWEETGCILEPERLTFIQERFYESGGKSGHEIVFFYRMKEASISIADGTFADQGGKESLHWLPIDRMAETNLIPTFLKTELLEVRDRIVHIVTKET